MRSSGNAWRESALLHNAERTLRRRRSGNPQPGFWPPGWGHCFWLAGVSGMERPVPSRIFTRRLPSQRSLSLMRRSKVVASSEKIFPSSASGSFARARQ